jgi:phytoene synthase
LIDGRESDLEGEPPASLTALEDYAEATSSRLVYLALEGLGVRDPVAGKAGHHIGIAYALTGLLRSMRFHAASGRRFITIEVLGDEKRNNEIDAIVNVAEIAARHLDAAHALIRSISRRALPALLPAVVAKQSLIRLKRAGYNLYDEAMTAPDPLQVWRLAAAMLLKRL